MAELMTTETSNGTPNYSKRLEQQAIGAMLRHNPAIPDVLLLVSGNDFCAQHQPIVSAISELWQAGKPVDTVSVAEALHAKGQIEDAGNYDYLAELWVSEPTGAHAGYYASLIREKSIFRRLHHAGGRIIDLAEHPNGPSEEVLAECEAAIFQISQLGREAQTATVSEIIETACDRIDERAARRDNLGIRTGLTDLDDLLGHFNPGELIIVAARPSVGKTAFALSCMYQAMTRNGSEVFLVSLEQSRHEIADRLLVMDSHVSSAAFRSNHLTQDDRARLFEASRRLMVLRGHIDDCACQNMLRIMANARRLKAKHDVKLIIVDYLQLIDPDSRRETRQEQVAAISRRLKQLARELQLPVMALCQLSRATETIGEPRLSHLRESGGIEADADTVIMLHKKSDGGPIATIEAIVAKQRNGPTGRVELAYVKSCMRFENMIPL